MNSNGNHVIYICTVMAITSFTYVQKLYPCYLHTLRNELTSFSCTKKCIILHLGTLFRYTSYTMNMRVSGYPTTSEMTLAIVFIKEYYLRNSHIKGLVCPTMAPNVVSSPHVTSSHFPKYGVYGTSRTQSSL